MGNKFKISIIVIYRTSRPKPYILAFRISIYGLSWLHIPQVADTTCAGVYEVALRASLQWQNQSKKITREMVLSASCLDWW